MLADELIRGSLVPTTIVVLMHLTIFCDAGNISLAYTGTQGHSRNRVNH